MDPNHTTFLSDLVINWRNPFSLLDGFTITHILIDHEFLLGGSFVIEIFRNAPLYWDSRSPFPVSYIKIFFVKTTKALSKVVRLHVIANELKQHQIYRFSGSCVMKSFVSLTETMGVYQRLLYSVFVMKIMSFTMDG